MTTKTIQMQRTATISGQGGVLHIKCKQTGRTILKLKAVNNRPIAAPYLGGGHVLLVDMCGSPNTAYDWSAKAVRQIAAYGRGEVQP